MKKILYISSFLFLLYANLLAEEKKIIKPELVVQTGHNTISSVVFSPNGKYIASGSVDKTIKLWDVESGKEIRTFLGNNLIFSVCFNPDGDYIASCGENIQLWDIASGKEIRTFFGHKGAVLSVSFSPDGKYLAGASNDSTIKIWEVENGKEIRTISNYCIVNSICFSQDGKFIASTNGDETKRYLGADISLDARIKLWEVASGNEIRSFYGHYIWIKSVCLSPDGKYVTSGSNDSTIKLWDIASGNVIRELIGKKGCIESLSFSPDGKYLISGGGGYYENLKLWDIIGGKEIRTFFGHENWIESVCFSPDGKYIVSGSIDGELILWDVASGKEIRTFSKYKYGFNNGCFSNDGNYIVISHKNTIVLFDLFSNKKITKLTGYDNIIGDMSISPNGRYIAYGSNDSTLILWDLAKDKEFMLFSGYKNSINSICFSQDGKYIASGGCDKKIKVWDISSRKIIKTFTGHKSCITTLCFSPDGKYIASGGEVVFDDQQNIFSGKKLLYENQIKLWNIENGNEIKTFSERNGRINSICFSPNSKYIASCGDYPTIKMWDIESGLEYRTFIGHTSNVQSLIFNFNGKILISGSWDNNIGIWDIDSSNALGGFDNNDIAISFHFNNDKKYLMDINSGGNIKFWSFKNGKEIVLITYIDSSNYLISTPDNYYTCSKGAYKGVAFRIGMHAYPFEQFDLRLNRPDIVLSRIGLAPKELIEAYQDAYLKRLRKMKFKEEWLKEDYNLPTAEITNKDSIEYLYDKEKVTFKIKATDENYTLDRINVYVNNVPIYGRNGLDVRSQKVKQIQKDVDLKLSQGLNKIQVSVLNEIGVESLFDTKYIEYKARETKPDLYVIAIGISNYEYSRNSFKSIDLKYADKDANDLSSIFKSQRKFYNQIHILPILNQNASRENILKLKDTLLKTNPDDVVLISFSGHGLLNDSLDYYLSTY